MRKLFQVFCSCIVLFVITSCPNPASKGPDTYTTVFSGTVTDDTTGAPIPDASITAGGENTSSDANGQYQVSVEHEGSVSMVVSKSNYQSHNGTVNTTDSTMVCYFTLTYKGPTYDTTVGGTVTDAVLGDPVQGATITANGQNTMSDSNGAYSITVFHRGDIDLSVTKVSYSSYSETISTTQATISRDIELTYTGSYTTLIAGQVVDSGTLLPIQNAVVIAGSVNAFTDGNGEYNLSVDHAGSFSFMVSKSNYQQHDETIITSDAFIQKDIQLVYTGPIGSLSGYVYFAGTTIPISGVTVQIDSVSDTTATDGYYELNSVPIGTNTITATKGGYDSFTTQIAISSGSQDFDIELTGGDVYSLSGYVRNIVNTPLYNASVTVLNPDGSDSLLIDTTDSNGHYQVPNVPQGTREVRYSYTGYNDKTESIYIYNADKTYDVVLEPAVVIQPPANPIPTTGSSIIDTTPQLDWEDIPEATKYAIQVNESEYFDGNIIADNNQLPASQYLISTPLQNNKTYYWRVKTQDALGIWGEWSDTWVFTVDLGTVQLSYPVDSEGVSSRKPIFSWMSEQSAVRYRIMVSTNSMFTADIRIDELVDSESYTPDSISVLGSEENTTFYWRVCFENGDGVWSNWSQSDFVLSKRWQKVEIDDDIRVCTIQMDSDDHAHVAYANLWDEIKYAFFNGTTWETNTVYTASLWRRDLFLLLDSNNAPHIFFTEDTKIMHAYQNGIQWISEIVTGTYDNGVTHIAIDNSNHIHVVYLERGIGYESDLYYALYNGSTWNIQFVEQDVGLQSMSVSPNGTPHIGYIKKDSSTEDYNLYYAIPSGSSWTKAIVDTQIDDFYHKIAVDMNGNLHFYIYGRIVYPGVGVAFLFKYKHFDGFDWSEKVFYNNLKDQHSTGHFHRTMMLDSTNNPHIIYGWYDTLFDDIPPIYTYRSGSYWRSYLLDESGYYGTPSPVLDSNDKLLGCYTTYKQIHVSELIGNVWSDRYTITEDEEINHIFGMTLDSDDTPYICYEYDVSFDIFKVAYIGWDIE